MKAILGLVAALALVGAVAPPAGAHPYYYHGHGYHYRYHGHYYNHRHRHGGCRYW